jgi:crotonobetainyl-CoA:carnitine CoA-transferase CaiB-like acyl-CoA transferase
MLPRTATSNHELCMGQCHFMHRTEPLRQQNSCQNRNSPPASCSMRATGEHTDEVLLELGYDMDRVIELKVGGAIL